MSARKIFFNTILQSIGKVVSVAIGLVTIALLTRYLGDEGFGEYTTVTAFMGFFGVLADLGLYLVTTRLISKEGADEKKILGNVFALRFVTVLGMLMVGAVIALFFPYSAEVKQAMFVGIAAFTFVSGTQVLIGVFQKHLIFYQLTASEIIQRTVMLGLVWWFISLNFGLTSFVWVLAISSGVHFFISLAIVRKFIPFQLQWDFRFWKAILTESWPLAFSVVLNLVYFRADTLILSVFKPAADVGVYGISYKILEVLMAFPAMFAGLIMPFLARFAFKEWPLYREYLQKSFDAVLIAIVPMVIITLFFARPIIDLVGGRGFADADTVLQVLIFATAILYLGNLLGYTVVALGIQKQMLKGYLLGAVVGLALYFLLIPKYSYFGAAYATIAVELIVFAYAYYLTSRSSAFYPSFSILGKAGIAGTVMALSFYLLKFPWIPEVIIGSAAYLGLLYVLGAIPKSFLQDLLAKRKEAEAIAPITE